MTGKVNGHAAGWTDQAEIMVLDNGTVLTPWGCYQVASMIRCNTMIDGEPMAACRVRLSPIEQPKVGLLL